MDVKRVMSSSVMKVERELELFCQMKEERYLLVCNNHG